MASKESPVRPMPVHFEMMAAGEEARAYESSGVATLNVPPGGYRRRSWRELVALVIVAALFAAGLGASAIALVWIVAADRAFGVPVPYALILPALAVTTAGAIVVLARAWRVRAVTVPEAAAATRPSRSPASCRGWSAGTRDDEEYVLLRVHPREQRKEHVA